MLLFGAATQLAFSNIFNSQRVGGEERHQRPSPTISISTSFPPMKISWEVWIRLQDRRPQFFLECCGHFFTRVLYEDNTQDVSSWRQYRRYLVVVQFSFHLWSAFRIYPVNYLFPCSIVNVSNQFQPLNPSICLLVYICIIFAHKCSYFRIHWIVMNCVPFLDEKVINQMETLNVSIHMSIYIFCFL